MAAEKTTGIVLRVIPFSETSCVVSFFTRKFGKMTTMAKGARRPKSPFEAALDVLAICRLVFLDKSSGAMGLLTEAKLERRFRSATKDLNQLYAGYYVVELLNTLNDEGDPHPELFDDAVATIAKIDSPEAREEPLSQVLLRFELRALELLGHFPMLTKCVSCGREKTTLAQVSFGLNLGGILCQTCRRGESNIITLSSNGLQFLLGLVGGEIGAGPIDGDHWNRPERESDDSISLDNAGTTVGRPMQVRENELEHRDWISRVMASSSSVPTDSTHDSELDQAKGLMEVRLLVQKYITHLLGFQPKLHKYLKNI